VRVSGKFPTTWPREGGRLSTASLARTTFTTSRLLEFCTRKELTLQTGQPVETWPLVVFKELVDNALDAAEEAGSPPRIRVAVTGGSIIITDNGPGIPAKTVKSVLDFSVRVSSREAYVSPTRGAQGNALKTILAMPYVLDGAVGRVEIEARGVSHTIEFKVDPIRQLPVIGHARAASSVNNGTRITVHWPDLACSILAEAEDQFLQIADNYTWLNPHLDLAVDWNGRRQHSAASITAWGKSGSPLIPPRRIGMTSSGSSGSSPPMSATITANPARCGNSSPSSAD
jgi:DNA topoisomerase VI subunit B